MTYELIIRPEAELDIGDAYQWYENQCQGLGRDLLLCIEASLFSIQRTPELYPIIYKNIHRALTRRFPYGIFYVIDGSKVIVIAIFHVRRDPKSWQNRV
jgi:toxin ParE1/3/4